MAGAEGVLAHAGQLHEETQEVSSPPSSVQPLLRAPGARWPLALSHACWLRAVRQMRSRLMAAALGEGAEGSPWVTVLFLLKPSLREGKQVRGRAFPESGSGRLDFKVAAESLCKCPKHRRTRGLGLRESVDVTDTSLRWTARHVTSHRRGSLRRVAPDPQDHLFSGGRCQRD